MSVVYEVVEIDVVVVAPHNANALPVAAVIITCNGVVAGTV